MIYHKVLKAQEYINSGYQHIVDIDLRNFFDEVDHAYAWSRTRMGGWAVAQSPILGTTITLDRLRKRGYVAMLTVYEKIAPHLNEPL
jgi:hypothetical protein